MPLVNFSGIASGIDSESLIKATLDAQRAIRITPVEEKIARLEDTNTSLTDLKTKVEALQDFLYDLTTANGGGIFKSATSSADTVMTASADQTASKGTYDITVTSLAKNDVRTSLNTYTTSDALVNSGLAAETTSIVTVTVGTGSDMETVELEITNTTKLNELAAQFNDLADKAVATVVKVSDGDYRLVFTSSNTGISLGQVAVSDPDTNFPLGFTASQAADTVFDIDGIATGITRPTNSISDVIPGVTLNLVDEGSATLTIGIDSNKTQTKIQEFVDKYNEVIKFINENNTIEQEQEGENTTNIFGPLTGTRLDENIKTTLRNVLGDAIIEVDEDSDLIYTNLSAIGVQTQRDGTLTFVTTGSLSDSDYDSAIAIEPDSVGAIFTALADAMSAAENDVKPYVEFNGLIDLSITANKDQITQKNDQISRAEALLARQETTMRAQFARLEALTGRMQSQQSALLSALGSLGTS